MALLDTTRLTLADNAKMEDPTGKIAVIANLLSQTNEILTDCVFVKANGKSFHRVNINVGLPEVYWTQVNVGTPPSKAQYATVDEGIGMLEARTETDIRAAALSGNINRYRMQQSVAHLEAMNQEMATCMFYGDTGVTSAAFLGLAGRYSALTSAGNSANVISGGNPGSSDDTMSIWLVGWGPETVYCTYPEGSTSGLQHRNLGEQTAYFDDGTRMQVYADLYNWSNGLVVKDWRYAVRIANLETAELTTLTATQAPTGSTSYGNVLHSMVQAVARIPNLSMCRPAFYMNRTAHTAMMRIAMEKSSSVLRIVEAASQFGTPRDYLSFMGIPIRRCDALLTTETPIT